MKIVMLCEFYNETLEYQENLLVKYYRKHGHDVTVLTSTFESVFDYYNDRHSNRWPARTFYDQGAKIMKLRYRYNLLNRLRAYTRIDSILEHEKPDLIYVHDISPNFPECIAYLKRHPQCRMIMDYHADYSNSGRNWLSLTILHGVLRKWFLDRARPYLSRICPVVPAGVTFLHEIYKVPHQEMEVLPLGCDIDLARDIAARGEGRTLRARMGLSDSDIVIFTGGKLAPYKKTELLFEAVAMLPHLPLQVVVVGEASESDAEYKQRLRSMTEGRSNIRFVGWLGREEIYTYLNMADLAVWPASQSIMWQAAIGSGLPLIVGNVGHQSISYLNVERNIIILERDEIRADRLAAAIEDATRPERLREMREGALRVADEHLNWNRLIERTLRYNTTGASARP